LKNRRVNGYSVEDARDVTLRTYLIDDWEMDYPISLIEQDMETLREWGRRDQAKHIAVYLDALKERRAR
jgi:hypothetical protein